MALALHYVSPASSSDADDGCFASTPWRSLAKDQNAAFTG
jgi:hypothetical protein